MIRHNFTDVAVEQFGEVETTQSFVMVPVSPLKFDVRNALQSDSDSAKIRCVASNNWRDGTRTVDVRDVKGNLLYRGTFDLTR